MHRYFWKGLIKTHTFFWSDWWKYCDTTQQSHVLVQPAAVVVVVTPSTGVAGCALCYWSQVSLLSCYSWRPSGMLLCLDTYRDTYCIVTSVSRYESYREAPVSLHPYTFYECLTSPQYSITTTLKPTKKNLSDQGLVMYVCIYIYIFIYIYVSNTRPSFVWIRVDICWILCHHLNQCWLMANLSIRNSC